MKKTVKLLDPSETATLVANMIQDYLQPQICMKREVQNEQKNSRLPHVENGVYLFETIIYGTSKIQQRKYRTTVRFER